MRAAVSCVLCSAHRALGGTARQFADRRGAGKATAEAELKGQRHGEQDAGSFSHPAKILAFAVMFKQHLSLRSVYNATDAPSPRVADG
jgi:hypothetical protein